jgi:DNA-binding GntR family transcriptional regulator
LEGLAARLAAASITEEQLARLSLAEQLFRRAVEDAVSTAIGGRIDADRGWGYANDLFHEAILTAAGNQVLEQAISDIHRRVPRNLTWSALRTPDQMRRNVHEHQQIRESLVAGDGEGARIAMISHVTRSGELIAEWFAARQDGHSTTTPR